MRQRAEWMKPVDDQILEFLEDSGAGTPQSIADALDRNNDYIGVRCRELTSRGFLSRPARGLYRVTENGSAYLRGDFDASDANKSE